MIGKYFLLINCAISIYGIAVFNVVTAPHPWQTALMARYIIHKADWVSIATISSHDKILNYPFVNLKSMSDGPVTNGTGMPYIFMTNMDMSGEDLLKDKRCTIMASLAQTDYCEIRNLDPQDPRCARTIITGKLVAVDNTTAEFNFAKSALFSRHPSMQDWPVDHQFFITKVNMEQILVLDFFGGIKNVTLKDYFDANPDSTSNDNIMFGKVIGIEVDVLGN